MNVLVVTFLFFSLFASAEHYMPEAHHYAMASQAQDCRVYQSLLKRSQEGAEENKRSMETARSELKLRREKLEACGRKAGASPMDDAKLAQKCPEHYDSWLEPGSRFQVAQREWRSHLNDIESITSKLELSCRH